MFSFDKFGSNGEDLGQFRSTIGITTDGNDRIIDVDRFNHLIQVFAKQLLLTIKITIDTTNGDISLTLQYLMQQTLQTYSLNIPGTSINNMVTTLTVQLDSYNVTETVTLN